MKALLRLFEDHPVIVGLAIRLLLVYSLPALLDDGLLLPGVRYTDIDYDVFTDAAVHAASGHSPYERHTYRYTPFLADLLALPIKYSSGTGPLLSTRYFGKIIFSLADVMCGYIIVVLRRNSRRSSVEANAGDSLLSHGLVDSLWWLYNPLPINICTRGSAESLVVLLPVLAAVFIANSTSRPVWLRACLAGIVHGIGIHAKLYPVIYTVSFMACFSRQQQQTERPGSNKLWRYCLTQNGCHGDEVEPCCSKSKPTLSKISADSLFTCFESKEIKSRKRPTFPWTKPKEILTLAAYWFQRLFMTTSSVMFLVCSIGTTALLTYLAVLSHGETALEEGLLYHFRRVDHRHNYSMYWYWIYLARGRAESALASTAATSRLWGFLPVLPQALILGFSSLGVAPYDLSFALFCQTFAFVAFNKVITAQYFTWYLCLLPLCSDRVRWKSKQMLRALGALGLTIVTWLLSAFTLEMLGWRTHRHVWLASLIFFSANVNLLDSILKGYNRKPTMKDKLG